MWKWGLVFCASVLVALASMCGAAEKSGIRGTQQRSAAAAPLAAIFSNRSPRTSTPTANFSALDDSGVVTPPCVSGAAGPQHLLCATSAEVRVQTRSGAQLSRVTLDAFWSALGVNGCFKPRIEYDPFAARFIFTACCGKNSAASAILVGVTQSSDPTGTWNLFKIDADAADLTWADAPNLGFNKNWIAVSNNFYNISDAHFAFPQVLVFSKADLYQNVGANFTAFPLAAGFSFVPAVTCDNSTETLFFIDSRDANIGQIDISSVTGAVGSETFNNGAIAVSAPESWSENAGQILPQKDSAALLQSGDGRMQKVVLRNGTLWCVQNIILDTPKRSGIQWWALSTDGTILQRGQISHAADSYDFPSLAVNKSNDIVIGCSMFSTSANPAAAYARREHSDALNSFPTPSIYQAGLAAYATAGAGGVVRWGEYSQTVVDPANDEDFWTLQEFAAAPAAGSDRWGTQWAQIAPPPVIGPGAGGVLSASGNVGIPFSYTPTASSGSTISLGTLPPWLAWDGTVLSGVPTSAGKISVTLTATSASGSQATTLEITIGPPIFPVIISATATSVQAGAHFEYRISASGSAPLEFSASGLPFGLIFTAPDIVSGVLREPGSYAFAIAAGNAAGTVSAQVNLTVTELDPDGDVDGDGFSNGFENQFGSSPFDSTDTPLGAPPQAAPAGIGIRKLRIRFGRGSAPDTISLNGTLPLQSYRGEALPFYLDLAGIIQSLTLRPGGRGISSGNGSLSLRVQGRKSGTANPQFTLTMRGKYAGHLMEQGVTASATDSELLLRIVFSGTLFQQRIHYNVARNQILP